MGYIFIGAIRTMSEQLPCTEVGGGPGGCGGAHKVGNFRMMTY